MSHTVIRTHVHIPRKKAPSGKKRRAPIMLNRKAGGQSRRRGTARKRTT